MPKILPAHPRRNNLPRKKTTEILVCSRNKRTTINLIQIRNVQVSYVPYKAKMNTPFMAGTNGPNVLISLMARATSQGIKTDIEAMEDEDPVVVVHLKVADEVTEEQEMMLVVAMVVNTTLNLLLQLLNQHLNMTKIRISRETWNNIILII